MISLAAAAPTVGAAFIASTVEVVEAFTIVLAVGVVAGIRPALIGTGAALAVLAAVVAALGPVVERIPVHGLQIVVGVLLLVFGLGWLNKAVLRAGGVLALHDEAAAFARQSEALRARAKAEKSASNWLAAVAAFKAVLLEGTEVVFIVLAVGARPGLLGPAALGAALACVFILALGAVLRRPLSKIPENSLKFVVGGLLTGFGVFWCSEGLGAPPPGGDLAIPVLIALYLAAGFLLSTAIRRQPREPV
ncbi:MAG: COG4280 domain-containing protein [Caulobacteraceae bacterium]